MPASSTRATCCPTPSSAAPCPCGSGSATTAPPPSATDQDRTRSQAGPKVLGPGTRSRSSVRRMHVSHVVAGHGQDDDDPTVGWQVAGSRVGGVGVCDVDGTAGQRRSTRWRWWRRWRRRRRRRRRRLGLPAERNAVGVAVPLVDAAGAERRGELGRRPARRLHRDQVGHRPRVQRLGCGQRVANGHAWRARVQHVAATPVGGGRDVDGLTERVGDGVAGAGEPVDGGGPLLPGVTHAVDFQREEPDGDSCSGHLHYDATITLLTYTDL